MKILYTSIHEEPKKIVISDEKEALIELAKEEVEILASRADWKPIIKVEIIPPSEQEMEIVDVMVEWDEGARSGTPEHPKLGKAIVDVGYEGQRGWSSVIDGFTDFSELPEVSFQERFLNDFLNPGGIRGERALPWNLVEEMHHADFTSALQEEAIKRIASVQEGNPVPPYLRDIETRTGEIAEGKRQFNDLVSLCDTTLKETRELRRPGGKEQEP